LFTLLALASCVDYISTRDAYPNYYRGILEFYPLTAFVYAPPSYILIYILQNNVDIENNIILKKD